MVSPSVFMRCTPGAASRILLLSLLPMLTFFGHWPRIEMSIPHTDSVVVFWPGEADSGETEGGHTHTAQAGGHSHADGHEQHCHVDASSCSDIPYTGFSTVLMLQEVVRRLTMLSGTESELVARYWLPAAVNNDAPAAPPPRQFA